MNQPSKGLLDGIGIIELSLANVTLLRGQNSPFVLAIIIVWSGKPVTVRVRRQSVRVVGGVGIVGRAGRLRAGRDVGC